jgi:hypothetical protein
MKEFYKDEHRPKFIELKNRIKTACANCIDKAFLIDDSISNLEAYKNINITIGQSPEEFIECGLNELANNRFKSANAEFNSAKNMMGKDDPLWAKLYYYRSLASNKGKINNADNNYKKAAALGFNKTTVSVYEIKTIGKRVSPGFFIIEGKRKYHEWTRAQRIAASAEKFFHEYAKILWRHFQNQNPDVAQKIFNESKKEVLSELENYLIRLKKDFNKKAIQQIREIVSEELDKPVKPTKNASPFISSDDKPESERRRVDENYTLASIRELYLTHTDIKSERQIRLNIALVLDAVNFWPERTPSDGKKKDKYIRRLKEHWIDVEKIALNLKNGLKAIEDQYKVCPLETVEK